MTQEDKIYFNIHSALYHHERHNEDDIVYIRDDDFIKKACEWLKENITNNQECNRIISRNGVVTMGMLIDDFKNYMKGE